MRQTSASVEVGPSIMQGAPDSPPTAWKRISAKRLLPREPKKSRRRTHLNRTGACATDPGSNKDGSPADTSSSGVWCCRRPPSLGALGADRRRRRRGITMKHASRRLETHSVGAPLLTSTAFREHRCPARDALKNYCCYLLRVCLFVIVVGSCVGRAKIQGERRTGPKQEGFEDNFTRSLSDAAVVDYDDLFRTVLDFSRSTRIPTKQKVTKGIPEQKKSKENSKKKTKNAECKKLENLESETEELNKAASENSDLVDNYCGKSGTELGCRPIPVVLHISKMCSSVPADINSYGKLKTVVDRCPPIPCCAEGQTCRTKVSIAFNRTFKVVQSGQKKFVTMTLRNDTACTCKKPGESVPKSRRKTANG